MEIRTLEPLTRAVMLMVAIDAAGGPALLLAYHLSPSFYQMHAYSDMAYAWVDIAMVLWWLATASTFCVWVMRAGNNLIALGHRDLEFTPASRIWWFFVPFMNLVRPYQAMRELWNASHGRQDLGDTVPLVAIWWGAWLLANFGGLILIGVMERLDESLTTLYVQSVANVALAAAAISLVRGIARGQALQRRIVLAEVFA